MKDTFVKANLTSLNTIKVMFFTNIPRRDNMTFNMVKDGVYTKLHVIKSVSQNSLSIFELLLNEKFEFGKSYSIAINDFGHFPLDVSYAPSFKEFDELFNYDKDDLGPIYHKDHTDFALWAPLASEVKLQFKDGETYPLTRKEKGVYKISIKGDLLNKEYIYLVTNSGVTLALLDPYAKSVGLNSTYSAVVDTDSIKNRKKVKLNKEISSYQEAIIYETNVRDFTEEETTDIVNKGKYLGLVEDNRKTNKGNPAGLDYLKYLGITHIQLQPVIDFRGVDDIDVKPTYNWGYDPISMFALEGSYSNNPENPTSRMLEFAKMVDGFHKDNIRVNIDIVFNHVYEYLSSTLEKLVPNYFFRRNKSGQIANASGCGNDFASERFMARKLIVDALKYFAEVYDVDGYRFDLMGLIDIKTLKEVSSNVRNIKKDFMLYGEGWDMGFELLREEKGAMINAHLMPEYAFFNDMYRDIMSGPHSSYELSKKGYINGDINYVDGAEFVISGCALEYTYDPKFVSPVQSLNYVECHDDYTLMDKLLVSNKEEGMDVILNRIKLANALTVLSFGIPFIHAGQEIGQDKKGNRNSYNVPVINNMRWDLLDERFEMAKYLKSIIEIRKECQTFSLIDRNEIDKCVSFYRSNNGVLLYKINNKEEVDKGKPLIVIINPTNSDYVFDCSDIESYYIISSSVCDNDNLDKISKSFTAKAASITIISK